MPEQPRASKTTRAQDSKKCLRSCLSTVWEVVVQSLAHLFSQMWHSEDPADWRSGVIVMLTKKGTLSDWNNWWGITLLSYPWWGILKCTTATFIDSGAFDIIHRESLWQIIQLYDVPPKYVNIFRALYCNSVCCQQWHYC